jgi:phospholipase C
MKKIYLITMICLLLSACAPVALQSSSINSINAASIQPTTTPTIYPSPSATATSTPDFSLTPSFVRKPTRIPKSTSTPTPPLFQGKIPNFDHIVLIVMENEGYDQVIGNPKMPNLNALAKQYVLLNNYFARTHPSLPNYISLVSGDTQKITSDCTTCFVDAPNLADEIEASGRTWKSYEESMPSPCFIGDANPYAQKHDPFIYFDSIRNNPARCQQSIVPLTQLDTDLAANQLPNFSFITPNLCNDGHNCSLDVADKWLAQMVNKLQSSPALGQNSLIIITFDEAVSSNKASCCGMPAKAGGQVATILISPLAKPGYVDNAPYSHFGLLKTILVAWDLPDLAKTKMPETQPIVNPWK